MHSRGWYFFLARLHQSILPDSKIRTECRKIGSFTTFDFPPLFKIFFKLFPLLLHLLLSLSLPLPEVLVLKPWSFVIEHVLIKTNSFVQMPQFIVELGVLRFHLRILYGQSDVLRQPFPIRVQSPIHEVLACFVICVRRALGGKFINLLWSQIFDSFLDFLTDNFDVVLVSKDIRGVAIFLWNISLEFRRWALLLKLFFINRRRHLSLKCLRLFGRKQL